MIRRILSLCALTLLATTACKSVTIIKTFNRFDALSGDRPFVLAYIYELDKDKPAAGSPQYISYQERFRAIDSNRRVLDAVLNKKRYRFVGMEGLLANTKRGDLDQLKKMYTITKPDTLILFKNGAIVRDSKGTVAHLVGPFSRESVTSFIEKYAGDYIDDMIKEAEREERKRERERERQEQRRAKTQKKEKVTYVTYGPGYWGGWPYYGGYGYYPYYGYGYRRPGVGFGISFGI